MKSALQPSTRPLAVPSHANGFFPTALAKRSKAKTTGAIKARQRAARTAQKIGGASR